jgi:broad specificity phosphatase PhoE
MRRRAAAAIGASLLLLSPCVARAQSAVFVVRHAEKATEANDASVPLSPAGAERARRLAATLKDAGISAIYSTDTVRTRATAQPLAEALKLPIQIYAPKDAQDNPTAAPLLAELARRGKDDVVLVVGHSNTIPVILRGLGASEAIELAPSDYDNLFLVVAETAGRPKLLRIHF